jgi:hypothetical protein
MDFLSCFRNFLCVQWAGIWSGIHPFLSDTKTWWFLMSRRFVDFEVWFWSEPTTNDYKYSITSDFCNRRRYSDSFSKMLLFLCGGKVFESRRVFEFLLFEKSPRVQTLGLKPPSSSVIYFFTPNPLRRFRIIRHFVFMYLRDPNTPPTRYLFVKIRRSSPSPYAFHIMSDF